MNPYDHIIKNGTIIDGTRAPRYQADIGISRGKIARIGDLSTARADRVTDAGGMIVSPGFIDVHAHSDAWLLKYPCFLPKVAQGFTTEFLMLDGISYAPVNQQTKADWVTYLRALNGLRLRECLGWQSIAEYMERLEGKNCQNTAVFIPYGNVRSLACGFDRQPVDDFQLKEVRSWVAQGMEEGALGISTGFDYLSQCFASTAELIAACQEMAKQKGVYVSHIRYQAGTLEGLKEAVEIGQKALVPVHISHLKGSTEAEAEAILNYLSTTAIHEVDFSFDVYPYSASSTMLSTLLPLEVWKEGSLAALHELKKPQVQDLFARRLARTPLNRIKIAWTGSQSSQSLAGKTLEEYITTTGRSAVEALTELLIDEGLAVLLIFFQGEDTLVSPFLAHPSSMIGSDGIYQEDGLIHPRLFGTAARLLGRCVRDLHLFTLEEAVYKLSGYPAKRFSLLNRGVIQEGYWADLVSFDAGTIQDWATFDDPRQFPTGIGNVWVNGVPIWDHGKTFQNDRPPLPGRFLRRGKLTEFS
jgi:N-acyl-D-amino-acid deacylase